jgi:hypothetical protein
MFSCAELLVVDLRPDSVVALHDGVSLRKWTKEVNKFMDGPLRKRSSKQKPGFCASIVPWRKRGAFAKHPRLSKQTIRQRLTETTLLVFGGTEIPPFLCSSFPISNWSPSSVVIPSKVTEHLFLGDLESGRNCHLLLHCLCISRTSEGCDCLCMEKERLNCFPSMAYKLK